MNEHLKKAIDEVESDVRSEFERIWQKTTNREIPEYRVLVWGSTIQPERRDPHDLDLIFEYTGNIISTDKQKSLEGWLKDSATVENFSHIDPLVIHYSETSTIISKSRVSRAYSVDENGWVNF